VELLEGMLFVELGQGMLSEELVKAVDGWMWHNGMIGIMPEVGFDCFGVFVVERSKDRMLSITGGWESTSWCDLLLWVVVVVKVEWVLAPFSTWLQGKWCNLWCGGFLSLSWYMQYGVVTMFGPRTQPCPGLGALPLWLYGGGSL
jgi:hypothetical protein